jgi:hypothetical protein
MVNMWQLRGDVVERQLKIRSVIGQYEVFLAAKDLGDHMQLMHRNFKCNSTLHKQTKISTFCRFYSKLLRKSKKICAGAARQARDIIKL